MIKFCRCFIVEICVFQYSQMNCGKTYEILYSNLAPISAIKHITYLRFYLNMPTCNKSARNKLD